MDIKAILKNIRKKGIRATLELRDQRKNAKKKKAVIMQTVDMILTETRDEDLFRLVREYYEDIYIPELYKDLSYADVD